MSGRFGDRNNNNGPRGNFRDGNRGDNRGGFNRDNRGDRDGGRRDFNRGPRDGRDGGRDGGRPGFNKRPMGGRQMGGMRTMVKPHAAYPGCYINQGKNDTLITKSMAPGVSVYGEKTVTVTEGDKKIEYREWNPFRSKLGAAILCRVGYCPIRPGAKVLYLGAASGTTVSHVSDMVGPEGAVYAVEFSKRSGRDLLEMAKHRPNVFPIIADARHPYKYRMTVPEVDAIFSDVAQADQARIVNDNARFYLKKDGGMMISIKASSVNSTMAPEAVFEQESNVLKEGGFKVDKPLSIDEFHKNHAIIVGKYMKE